MFPTKPLNQSRRILHWGQFRRNGRISAEFRTRGSFPRNRRINPAEFLPNFAFGTFPPKRPNQCSRISAEFRTRGRFRRNGRTSAKFRPRGSFPQNGRISAEFLPRGRFPRNG
ncbi:MAG: hypothetical protein Q8881_04250 [Sweet potato little leaf phytoplasma]|nr:hypothetical protein [Sweet potato little leaf phytoplasma]